MTGPERPPDPVRRRPGGWLFWLSAALGWLVIAAGIRGALVNRIDTRPLSLARFVVGGVLVHDLLVAPLAVLAGALIARALRRQPRARPAVQAAAVLTATAAVFAFPLVRGYGRAVGNPTSLPRDYGAGLAVVVASVWLAAAAVAILASARGRRRTGGTRRVRRRHISGRGRAPRSQPGGWSAPTSATRR